MSRNIIQTKSEKLFFHHFSLIFNVFLLGSRPRSQAQLNRWPFFRNVPQKYFLRKFHQKPFRIRFNTILNTKRAKYEGLTPPELEMKICNSQKSGFFAKSLIYIRKTIGNQGKTRVSWNKTRLSGCKFFSPSSGGIRPSYLARLVFSIVLEGIRNIF